MIRTKQLAGCAVMLLNNNREQRTAQHHMVHVVWRRRYSTVWGAGSNETKYMEDSSVHLSQISLLLICNWTFGHTSYTNKCVMDRPAQVRVVCWLSKIKCALSVSWHIIRSWALILPQCMLGAFQSGLWRVVLANKVFNWHISCTEHRCLHCQLMQNL